MADSEFDDGIRMLQRRATNAKMAIYAFLVAWAGMLAGNLAESTGAVDLSAEYPDTLTGLVALVYVGASIAFVVSVVAVSLWIHRAHKNLIDSNVEGLDFSPGWSVGWFFVPFANLVMPFRAMRELWNESQGLRQFDAPESSPLGWWWATWLGGNILSTIGTRMSDGGLAAGGGFVSALSAALLIASAVLLLRIVRETTEAQAGGRLMAGVFA